MKHDIVIANATSWKICGTFDGKAFEAFWETAPGAINGYGKWRVDDPGNRFSFGDRVSIAKGCRAYLQTTGIAEPCLN